MKSPGDGPSRRLNYLLSSHVWRQDHNGFSHQDPGFIDHVVNKKAEVVRVYLPPDANCLLSVTDHCLRSRNYVNVVVAGKQPAPQWLTMDEAIKHCAAGLGIWEWASNDRGAEPDVVMACCGDVPTLETLAAVDLLRLHAPELKVRVINVVNLMKLQPPSEHPHGLSDHDFDALFTTDKPIIFAFHGYPWLIHRLTYRRTGHGNLHVRGYKEEGTTSTPFDMCVLNDLDRFHLVNDVIDRVPGLGARAAYAKQAIHNKLIEHKEFIARYGDDMPEITGWKWGRRRRRAGSVRQRPTTSEPAGGGRERLRDQARRDRVEPERTAHGHDGHPVDRQRTATRRADAARAGQRGVRAGSREPHAAGAGNLRAGGARRGGRGRPRPGRVGLRRVRGTDAQADPRGGAGLADLPGRMPGRRSAGAGRGAGGSGDRPGARRPRATSRCSRTATCCACSRPAGSGCPRAAGNTSCWIRAP